MNRVILTLIALTVSALLLNLPLIRRTPWGADDDPSVHR